MFDPEKFGEAMGAAIREAVAPLQKRVDMLEKDLEGMASQLQREIEAFNADPIPGPAGTPGKDAESVDTEAIVKAVFAQMPAPASGKDGANGKDGKDGDQGQRGEDGLGVAGAMIDRDGALQITLTNGEIKNLGPVVGKNGVDGKDGLSLDGFDLEYLPEFHEIQVKAMAAGRVKEVRYPAGGIRPAGYWREGTKAQAGEAWVHDGSLWIAIKSTSTKPATGMDDWIIAARKGRDGERGAKGADGSQPPPIKLGA